MMTWLSKLSEFPEGVAKEGGGDHGRYLGGAGDFVTSGFRTPEEVGGGGVVFVLQLCFFFFSCFLSYNILSVTCFFGVWCYMC